jgi:hypothetical protein
MATGPYAPGWPNPVWPAFALACVCFAFGACQNGKSPAPTTEDKFFTVRAKRAIANSQSNNQLPLCSFVNINTPEGPVAEVDLGSAHICLFRQTITLLFDQALPAGSFPVQLGSLKELEVIKAEPLRFPPSLTKRREFKTLIGARGKGE